MRLPQAWNIWLQKNLYTETSQQETACKSLSLVAKFTVIMLVFSKQLEHLKIKSITILYGTMINA